MEGVLKVNVDASFYANSETFKIGMVLRNQNGVFLVGRNKCLQALTSVFEAVAISVLEALTWINDQQLLNQKVEL